ncbi:reticulon-4-interacting protein 1 homolog, mitochondrial [Thrips palmi]|uniref:Reticulon-4-interacting protein 1 homolog, mitochondrial n=1 Tax=Thrips palmi TaxID=161013 RepID=A0A6P9A0W1_THRPL|nr:reticulon-4-interacting protein 1 homolog, mitochondrial [Thrips palmi]
MAFVLGSPLLRHITKLSSQTCALSIKENYTIQCNGLWRVSMPFSTTTTDPKVDMKPKEGKICAWQVHAYGGVEELQLSCSVREPVISKPDDVLVNVSASSVNPIDVAMMNGYGATLFNKIRQAMQTKSSEPSIEFPLTLGRDFAGKVIAVGHNVINIKPGDDVWGVIAPTSQGCHAQKVVLSQSNIRPKPKNLTMEEASSILYAAVTAWSALRITGDLLVTGARGKRILVLGAAGGVGSVAVQMGKAWGAAVVGTCRSDAVPLVQSLGADAVIDYALPDSNDRLRSEGQFDVILDAAGLGPDAGPYASCLKQWSNAKYITLRSPLLKNFDEHGLVLGALKSAADLVQPNITTGALSQGATMRWGFFMPCNAALDEIQLLVEAGKVSPCIQKVFPFADLPKAYQMVLDGHLRGKVVVSL